MAPDNAQHCREPEPVSGIAGSEKGIEHTPAGLVVQTTTVVFDTDTEVFTRGNFLDESALSDGNRINTLRSDHNVDLPVGPVADRLAGIGNQVHEGLADFCNICLDRWIGAIAIDVDCDSLRRRGLLQVFHLADQVIHVESFGLDQTSARVCQKFIAQLSRAAR